MLLGLLLKGVLLSDETNIELFWQQPVKVDLA